MRKYSIEDENKIRVEHLVREWSRSGLLDKSQMERMLPDLNVQLRRTNVFLRAILFAFTIVILAAVVLLAADMLGMHEERELDGLFLMSALPCILLAEYLAGSGLYRFGVEEGATTSAVILGAFACLFMTSRLYGWQGELPQFVGLTMAALGATIVYLRFRYRYAVVAAMVCMSMAPLVTPASEEIRRLASASILACIFVVIRSQRGSQSEEVVLEEHGFIQATAWLGVYVWLNLFLPWGYASIDRYSASFHIFSYAMTWILPVIGLAMAIRKKDRLMLDVNLLLALATLATNKAYLGLEHRSWDPILFGLLLIGAAVGVRRWLATDERRGFTPLRILSSDARRMSTVATASGVLNSMKGHTAAAPDPAKLESGGGRSGGAGASGSY